MRAVGRTKALSSKTAHSLTDAAVAAERCTVGIAVVQLTAQALSSVSMRGNKFLSRESSTTWRAWRKTTIRVFVGLNLLIIVGFYVATSSFHGGLSHMDESSSHTLGTDAHRHGKLSSHSRSFLLLVMLSCCRRALKTRFMVCRSVCPYNTFASRQPLEYLFFEHMFAQC